MRRPDALPVLFLAALLAACSADAPGPSSAAASQARASAPRHRNRPGRTVTVMTRNLYLGADIQRLAAASTPADVPAIAGAMWGIIHQTDFPSRAKLLAAEIDESRPDLVALEEVSIYRTGPPLSCVGVAAPATDVALDFLAILQAEIAALGLDYQVAASVENLDAQLCTALSATSFIDVRLTDRDVILARAGLETASPRSGHFAAEALFPAAGSAIPVVRGWNTVEVKGGEGWFRFAMAHLETEDFPPVQEAQARELLGIVGPGPLVLAGDFNAGPGLAGVTSTYGDLLRAGLRDAWPRLHGRDPGPTCCLGELLTTGALTQRVDLVLYRGEARPRAIWRTGLSERTASGMRASDHAGVAAVFRVEGDDDGDEGGSEGDWP